MRPMTSSCNTRIWFWVSSFRARISCRSAPAEVAHLPTQRVAEVAHLATQRVAKVVRLRAKRGTEVVHVLVDGRKSHTHLVAELHNLRLDRGHPFRQVLEGRHLHFKHLNTLFEVMRRHTRLTTTVASSTRMFNGTTRPVCDKNGGCVPLV